MSKSFAQLLLLNTIVWLYEDDDDDDDNDDDDDDNDDDDADKMEHLARLPITLGSWKRVLRPNPCKKRKNINSQVFLVKVGEKEDKKQTKMAAR